MWDNKFMLLLACCILSFNLLGQNKLRHLIPTDTVEMTDVYYLLFHHLKEGQEKPINVVWLMNDTAVLSQWQTDQFNIEGRYEYFDLTNDLVMYRSGNFSERPVAYDMKNVTTYCDYIIYEPDSLRKIRYMDCSLAYAHNGEETYKMYINDSFGINFSPFAKIKGIPFYFEYFNPETGENYQQYVVRIKKSKVPVSYFRKSKNFVDRTGKDYLEKPPTVFLPHMTLKTFANEEIELIPPFDKFQVLYFCTKESEKNIEYFIKFMQECRLSLIENTDAKFDFYSICKFAEKNTATQFMLKAKEWHHAKNYVHAFAKMDFFPFNCLIITAPNGEIIFYREKFVAEFTRKDLFNIIKQLEKYDY